MIHHWSSLSTQGILKTPGMSPLGRLLRRKALHQVQPLAARAAQGAAEVTHLALRRPVAPGGCQKRWWKMGGSWWFAHRNRWFLLIYDDLPIKNGDFPKIYNDD